MVRRVGVGEDDGGGEVKNTQVAQMIAIAEMLFGSGCSKESYITVVPNPQHTRNLFGPISEIAGKRLQLMERNSRGDCMCLFTGVQGQYLVDVDHGDVEMGVRNGR